MACIPCFIIPIYFFASLHLCAFALNLAPHVKGPQSVGQDSTQRRKDAKTQRRKEGKAEKNNFFSLSLYNLSSCKKFITQVCGFCYKAGMVRHEEENVTLGGSFIFVAAAAYACMGALVKFGGEIPDEQLVFVRNFVCLLLLLPWIFLPKPKPLQTAVFKTHLIRATAGLLNMYCFFYSIRYILLTDAMLLNNTMPLFVPLVVWVWKKEKLPIKLIPGLIIGFLGIIFILRPGRAIISPAALVALASGIFMSISMAGIRELGKFEPIYRILFYYFLISSCISAIPLTWAWENHSMLLWMILLGVGIFAAIYQYFLTLGYQYASAAKISPIIYFAVILSGVFDWIFWNKIPDIMSYLGAVLVIIGAVWCVRIESKVKPSNR